MSTNKSTPSQNNKDLVKSGMLVSLGVLTSRMFGFIRDIILAHVLGTGPLAEAFFVAQRIPNLFRDLVGEGASNSAIVPVLSEYHHKHSRAQWLSLINVIMMWGVIILGSITIVGMIAAPWIVRIIAPGFVEDPEKFKLTVDLTRIMFPYLILIALTAVQTGILYCLRSFFAPAFGPCLLNIAMILSVWIASIFSWPFAYVLSCGVLVGGVWQFLFQWNALKKNNVEWSFKTQLHHAGAIRIGKLLLPRIWGSAVYQINILADTFCASLAIIVGSGGIAAIYYANRIVQFPLGVFGYALSSVALPSLSASAAKNDFDEFHKTLLFALKNLLYVLIPIAVCIALTSNDIISSVFERGKFDAYSTEISSQALMYYILGLPFFGISRLLVSSFYAIQDTRTPVRIATLCLCINVVGNVILMFPLKIGGIALASSISSAVNVALLIQALKFKIGHLHKEIFQFIATIIVPLGVMVVLICMLQQWLICPKILKTIIILVTSAGVFVGMSLIMKVQEAHYILNLIKRRFSKK